MWSWHGHCLQTDFSLLNSVSTWWRAISLLKSPYPLNCPVWLLSVQGGQATSLLVCQIWAGRYGTGVRWERVQVLGQLGCWSSCTFPLVFCISPSSYLCFGFAFCFSLPFLSGIPRMKTASGRMCLRKQSLASIWAGRVFLSLFVLQCLTR